MFSATFSDEIRKLSRGFLQNPELIEVARRNALADNVEQRVFRVASDDAKRAAVGVLVRERGLEQVIVFTNTKLGASRLARQLQRDGLNADAIHGDKSQQERLQTLDGFKEGRVKILVATDVAARGLDIAELPAVINFDLPHSPEDYVHRIGRTGRAGASGQALSLMTERDTRALAEIEKLTRRKLPAEDLQLPVTSQRLDRRSDWGDSGDRGRRGGRDGSPPARGRRAAKPAADPLFSEPYQPSQEEPVALAVESGRPCMTRNLARPRKVAVLLGGKLPGAKEKANEA